MEKVKGRLLPLLLIFINMLIVASVMESAYYIENFSMFLLLGYAFFPVLTGLGFIGALRGRGKLLRGVFFFLFLGAAYVSFLLISNLPVEKIPSDLDRIVTLITRGQRLSFQNFEVIMKLLVFAGSVILTLTLYIFPYQLIIFDMGLIFFLWIVDYYDNTYRYLRYFLPLWAFSIILYRSALADKDAKNFKVNKGARILQAVALSLVITLASLLINIDVKGVYSDRIWNYFNNQVVPETFLEGRSMKDPFNISASGYTDSERLLGGNVNINEDEVLWAVGEEPIYLRGNVRLRYTGVAWARDNVVYETGGRVDAERVARYEELVQGDEEALKMMEIRPRKTITSNLFNSLYAREITFPNSFARVFYDPNLGVFASNETVTDNYRILYYQEDAVEKSLRRVNSGDGLSANSPYLQLPFTVTERTRELTMKIVQDIPTVLGRAEAITAYLKANYAYTLTPDTPRDYVDFVDYFLFEDPEGYCVYYATALTVMLRIAGVPARYVEGYKMGTEMRGDRYIVRNSDAHAWTEVLLDAENDIWMTFDATGTPRELIYGEEPNPDDGPVVNPDDPVETAPNETGSEKPRPGQDEEDPDVVNPGTAWFRLLLQVLLITGASFLLLLFLVKKWRIHQAYSKASLKPYFREITQALAYLYMERQPGETHLEMAARIKDKAVREAYTRLVEEVYKEEFSKAPGHFEERKELRERVYLLVRDYRGRVFYLVRKHFW